MLASLYFHDKLILLYSYIINKTGIIGWVMKLSSETYRNHQLLHLKSVLILIILGLALFFMCGCAATETQNRPHGQIKPLYKWNGDYPVTQLSRLPAGQQEHSFGYIGEIETFLPMWRIFMPTEILPSVDFTKNLIVFIRDTKFYNQKSILTIRHEDTTAEILAMETMSTIPLEDKVAMAMAVIPRTGITYIKYGAEIIKATE